MEFEDGKHLHAGYYEDGFDLEGTFFKQKEEKKWFLFFQNDLYNLPLKKQYKVFNEDFGFMVREYYIENELTVEKANELFKEFLLEEDLIK